MFSSSLNKDAYYWGHSNKIDESFGGDFNRRGSKQLCIMIQLMSSVTNGAKKDTTLRMLLYTIVFW